MASQMVWSCEIELDYSYYRIGEPGPEAIVGLQTAALAGGEAGVFVGAADPDSAMVRLEVLITDPVPDTEAAQIVSFRSTPEAPAGITTWENGETRPESYDLIGPGSWQAWVERQIVTDPNRGQIEDHRLHLYPADAQARGWAQRASAVLALRHEAALAAAEGEQLSYTEFLRLKAGVYFVVWDTDSFARALAVIDLKVALPDDLTLLELPGGVAFRQRSKAETWVGAQSGALDPHGGRRVERLVRYLGADEEARVLDAQMQPVRRVPDPAAKTPCVLQVLRGDPDYAAWERTLHITDEAHATRVGVHSWYVFFADREDDYEPEGAPRGR
jgi:hypothetical protein